MLLLAIVAATTTLKVVLPISSVWKVVGLPLSIWAVPFKNTVKVVPERVPLVFVQFPRTSKFSFAKNVDPGASVKLPAIITAPAAEFSVSLNDELIWTFPNVIAALGVMDPLPVK